VRVSHETPTSFTSAAQGWSRLHCLISLELDRHLVSVQLDPEGLLEELT
jgi:hypothetical protein